VYDDHDGMRAFSRRYAELAELMKEVKQEAKRRKIKLVVLPTTQAIKALKKNPDKTNAILHVTC
jgi:hypothetical protein